MRDVNSTLNQSNLNANTCNRRQARENACEQVTIGFGLVSHWLRKWRKFSKPIPERSKTNQSSYQITFDSQLKTALKPGLHQHKYKDVYRCDTQVPGV